MLQSVLITGGTGTFGTAMVRYLLSETFVSRICIFSRGEHAQAAMRLALGDTDDRVRWFIGDVRDLPRLQRAMIGQDAVIHAAALKRIEVGSYNPDEMVKTNVLGTMNVLEAAARSGCVERVVYLSSDKAFQPISPYGQTKALAESLVLQANTTWGKNGPVCSVARYGNIWGSQGSVGPLWRLKVAQGVSTLPVTDKRCTRFFMRLAEAVDLVTYLLFKSKGGELAIPEQLPAYQLGDLVEAFGCVANETGLPAWEKMHESMREGLCSADARRMTVEELRMAIEELP